jgi:hypothetical protein
MIFQNIVPVTKADKFDEAIQKAYSNADKNGSSVAFTGVRKLRYVR